MFPIYPRNTLEDCSLLNGEVLAPDLTFQMGSGV